ncbi:hypothetical protein AX16_007139 [Volvariella volvacea WC 439]|nr:hypothetical protein AX16_007139 [Volvariella volvacea WC 439]
MLNIDWARYLPEGQPLSRRVHDKLLDLLFRFVTCYCLRVIPPLFLRDMWRTLSTPLGQPPPKAPHYSPMLHNALLAVASCFCDEPEVYETARDLFAAKAKSYLDEEADHPRISLVHSLSMLSAYHSSRGEQMLGYLYFGMSARISQALGVGIDCSDWVKNQLIEEHDRLDRNWVHWTTLNQDVCWSLYVGRDLSCQVPSNLRGIPVPYVDADFDEQPWVYPPSGLAPQPNNLLKTFAATCQLLLIARRIMDVVNKLNAVPTRPEVIDDIVSSIDLQLNTWKRDLCPEVEITSRTRAVSTPHRLVIHMNYWWLFILLHRPFYNRQIRPSRSGCTSNIDHIKLCKRSAENIMELLATYRSLYGLRYIPISVVQVVFATGTVWLLVAVQATVGVRMAKEAFKRAYAQAQLCITYLEEMGRSWKCASDVADIFKQLMFEKLKRWLDRGTLIGDADDNNPSKRSLSCSPVTKFACIRSSAAPSSPQGSISSPRTDSRDSTPSDQISSGSLKHSSSLPVIDSQFQSGQNLWYTHPAQIPSTVTSPTMMFGQPMVPVSHETLSHTSALNGQSYSGSVNSMQSTYSVADYVAAQQMYQPIQPSPFDDPSMDFLFSLTFDGSDSTSNYQRAMRCGMTLFGHPVVPVNTLTTDTPITDANAYRNIFGVDMVSEPQQHGGDRIMSDVSSGDVDMQHPGQRSSTSESLHMPPMNFANRGFFI